MGRPAPQPTAREDSWRERAIWTVVRIFAGCFHGVTAPRPDAGGKVRPLTGPCRLAIVDGRIVATDRPGTDETNYVLLRAVLHDDELEAALPDEIRSYVPRRAA